MTVIDQLRGQARAEVIGHHALYDASDLGLRIAFAIHEADRHARILVGRFGIGGVPVRTLKQIGKELGITRERVRQIEARAQDKLRALARTKELVLSQS